MPATAVFPSWDPPPALAALLARLEPGAAPADEVVLAIAAFLTAADPRDRFYAAYALGELGVRAGAAAPALRQALADDTSFVERPGGYDGGDDYHVGGAAAVALSRLGPAGRAALAAAVNDPDAGARARAAAALQL